MGTPSFYWYPDEDGSLQRLDLGEALSDIEETNGADVADSYAADRTPFRAWYASTFRVRVVLERFGTSPGANATERALLTLQSHLQRGGAVGFSRDHAKTWGAIRSGVAARGDATFYTPGNGFTGWSSSATLASGDELVIEDLSGRRELNTVSSLSASGDITLGSTLMFSYEGHPLVRWRDFYPFLTLPADQLGRDMVAHDHRRNWTLDVTLEYSAAAAIGLWGDSYMDPYGGVGGLSLRDTTGVGGLGLDEIAGGRVFRAGGLAPRGSLGRVRGRF